MAVASIKRTVDIGSVLMPPYGMSCMEEFPIESKCKYPGTDLEQLAHILGAFSIQARFKMFQDVNSMKKAFQNNSIHAANFAMHHLDFSNLSISVFPWLSDLPAFAIRRPVDTEIPKFMILTTFGYEIWVCIGLMGAFLFASQHFINRRSYLLSNKTPAIVAWWLTFGL